MTRLQSNIEAAIARELANGGFPQTKIDTVLHNLRTQLATLRPELRASAAFIRYVEMVEAIVEINGPGPNYERWHKGARQILRSWKKPYRSLDAAIRLVLPAHYEEAKHHGS